MLVTKNSLIAEKDGGLQVMNLDKNLIYDLNRESLGVLVSQVLPIIRPILYLLPILIYIGSYASYALSLIGFFLLAVLVWLIIVIRKSDGGYMHAYRVTIHAITLGYLLDLIYSLVFGASFGRLAFVIITLIVVLINIKGNTINSAQITTNNSVVPQ